MRDRFRKDETELSPDRFPRAAADARCRRDRPRPSAPTDGTGARHPKVEVPRDGARRRVDACAWAERADSSVAPRAAWDRPWRPSGRRPCSGGGGPLGELRDEHSGAYAAVTAWARPGGRGRRRRGRGWRALGELVVGLRWTRAPARGPRASRRFGPGHQHARPRVAGGNGGAGGGSPDGGRPPSGRRPAGRPGPTAGPANGRSPRRGSQPRQHPGHEALWFRRRRLGGGGFVGHGDGRGIRSGGVDGEHAGAGHGLGAGHGAVRGGHAGGHVLGGGDARPQLAPGKAPARGRLERDPAVAAEVDLGPGVGVLAASRGRASGPSARARRG